MTPLAPGLIFKIHSGRDARLETVMPRAGRKGFRSARYSLCICFYKNRSTTRISTAGTAGNPVFPSKSAGNTEFPAVPPYLL